MVLTDRQRADLHAGIYEYLLSQSKDGGVDDDSDPFARAATALAEADPKACSSEKATASSSSSGGGVPILEKKWTAVPRLQRKVLELERAAAQNAKIHAHRSGGGGGDGGGGAGGAAGGDRRMIPRPPATHTLQGHQGVVTCVTVHPVYTVAVSGSEDGTVKIWDHESGEYVRTLKGHTNTVHSVAFTATGSHLASSSSDLSIKLWDFSTYTCIRTLRGHDHTISCVRFIPLPQSALSSQQSASGGSNAGEASASGGSTGVDISVAGSSTLVSASRDETVKFWDIETGFCVHTLSDHRDWVRAVAVRESDGELVATTGNDTVIIVYRATGDRKKVCELRGHEHVVESVAFVTAAAPASEAGKNRGKAPASEQKHLETVADYLASGGRDRSVRLWSVSAASCLFKWTAHENWVRSVVVHPTGKYVISAGDDRSVRVFDIKSNRCLRTIDGAHPHFVTSLAMHHTLPVMVSGGVDQTVKCWQLD